MPRSGRWAAVLLLLALVVTACSGDDDPSATPDPTDDPAIDDPADDEPDTGDDAADDGSTIDTGAPPQPEIDRYGWVGENIAITMARANRSSGYIHAEIVRLLLKELGYTVNELQNIELAPAFFHGVLGEGEIDLWANGRVPDDGQYWSLELSDGSTVGEQITTVGDLLPGAGLQGFVTNAVLPVQTPDLTLDLINDDDEIRAPFDAADAPPTDDAGTDAGENDDEDVDVLDGVVQILGCPEDSLCADQIDEMIRFARWRNIEQRYGERDELAELALRRIATGEPVIIYLGGPSAQLAQLIPGENVVWLSVEPDSVLDGSITPEWDQRVDGEAVAAPVDAAACTTDPCFLSWQPTELRITARVDFLDRNPAAATLLEAITIPVADLAFALSRQDRGVDVELIAAEWIAANRETVDGWLADAARAAR